MFELNGKLNRLDIPAQKVLRLKKSLGDVQTALPGQHSQLSTAYICAFSAGKGARVAVAFHLKEDFKLIFYLNDGGEISNANAGAVMNEATNFAESLGFMMDDLDYHKLAPAERITFWDTCPLKSPPAKPKPPAPPVKAAGGAAPAPSADVVEAEELSVAESVELDLGLPRRQLVVQKKQRPSPAELEKKRVRLRENLGRFLSSL